MPVDDQKLLTPVNGNPTFPESPWEGLESLRLAPLADRGPYLDLWLERVATRPTHEQDALLTEGREVFRYRMETVRKHLKESPLLAKQGPDLVQLCVASEEFLAETTYRTAPDPETGFLVYRWDRPEDPPEWRPTVVVGSRTFLPPMPAAVSKGIVLFPSACEDYGSDAELEKSIRGFLNKYIQFEDPDFRELLIAYTLYTWISDRIPIAPYLRLLGDFSAGKTTTLHVAWQLVYRGIFAAGAATAAPLFRVIDQYRGTLILDEADFDQRNVEWQQILKILLVGHTKGQTILRAEKSSGDNSAFAPVAYDCFGPKMLATRRPFNDPALESRCLTIHMRLLEELDPNIPLFHDDEFLQEAAQLRNQLLWWRFQHYRRIKINSRERIPETDPRLNAIALALLTTINPGDSSRRESLLRRIKNYSEIISERRRESPEGNAAEAIVTQWEAQQHPHRLQLSKITEEVRRSQEGMTPEKVSALVRGALGLRTYRASGFSWVRTEPSDVRGLARRYGFELKTVRTPVGR